MNADELNLSYLKKQLIFHSKKYLKVVRINFIKSQNVYDITIYRLHI